MSQRWQWLIGGDDNDTWGMTRRRGRRRKEKEKEEEEEEEHPNIIYTNKLLTIFCYCRHIIFVCNGWFSFSVRTLHQT